jgi:division protein CdvB (Snf7/Vps24/ESCRT-III family)
MPVNAAEDEGIDDILYRIVLFIQLMAIRNRKIQERDTIVRELQILNRRFERSKARNTNRIREEIQDLERKRERLEAHINRLELSEREVNPTQMNAFINHQNN